MSTVNKLRWGRDALTSGPVAKEVSAPMHDQPNDAELDLALARGMDALARGEPTEGDELELMHSQAQRLALAALLFAGNPGLFAAVVQLAQHEYLELFGKDADPRGMVFLEQLRAFGRMEAAEREAAESSGWKRTAQDEAEHEGRPDR
jgi:hypothetical protein